MIPPVVAAKAVRVGAHNWLDGLPALIADLQRDWGITLGRSYPDPTEAYVVEATCEDGASAVLKLVVPRSDDAARHEIAVLQLVDGDGCVPLLRADAARGAILLPRLGPSLHDRGLPYAVREPILADLAARVWRPASNSGLPTGVDKARWLAEGIERTWEELGRPCTEAAVRDALACCARRRAAHDESRAVLVHGDVHEWNALRSGDGWALIDPDGLLAEPEYDLGVLMREDPLELLAAGPDERVRRLARRTDCDPVAIWEWGVAERVSTGLLATAIDLQPIGRQMLHAADIVAGGSGLAGASAG